jgi:hypothetical protein
MNPNLTKKKKKRKKRISILSYSALSYLKQISIIASKLYFSKTAKEQIQQAGNLEN